MRPDGYQMEETSKMEWTLTEETKLVGPTYSGIAIEQATIERETDKRGC